MAVFHGKSAKVTIGATPLAFTTGWSMQLSADVAESTYMGNTWKSFEVGQEDGSATVNGNAATTRVTVSQLGVSAALLLYVNATNKFSLTSICTGIIESVTKDDVGKISYSFKRNQSTDIVYG